MIIQMRPSCPPNLREEWAKFNPNAPYNVRMQQLDRFMESLDRFDIWLKALV